MERIKEPAVEKGDMQVMIAPITAEDAKAVTEYPFLLHILTTTGRIIGMTTDIAPLKKLIKPHRITSTIPITF